jgi:predicted RNA binding protein YcfA (HicA-like mRNA interferase family)
VLEQLRDAGWQQVSPASSHRQFKLSVYRDWVTVAGKPSDDETSVTLDSIRKKAGLKR